MSRPAVHLLVEPVLAEFRSAYTDVTLDTSLDEGMADLASGLFDGCIRQGEMVEEDMLAVRLSPHCAGAWLAVPPISRAPAGPERLPISPRTIASSIGSYLPASAAGGSSPVMGAR